MGTEDADGPLAVNHRKVRVHGGVEKREFHAMRFVLNAASTDSRTVCLVRALLEVRLKKFFGRLAIGLDDF